jgi:hypothetical protein
MSYIGRTPTNAALTAADLADGIVSTDKIAADAVTDAKIADDVVGTEHLTANEVDTTALGADAVTGAQLADDAVNSEHYTDGSIDTAHLADGQVTTAKLATAVFTGATDIGADIADADLFLMDDGAGGTIRKTAASRLKTYIPSEFRQLLSASSGTDASEIVFDDLDVSTYSTFMLMWFSQPTTDDGVLFMQMRTGGGSGSNFTTTAYDSAVHGTSADNTYYAQHEPNAAYWRVHQNAGNNTVEYHQSQIFFTPYKSGYQAYLGNFMSAQGTRYDSGGAYRTEVSCGAYNHSDYPTPTGFRMYYHSGDINKYNYKLYGIV